MELWDKLLEEYDQLVYIPMTSGLSGTAATAASLACDDPYEGRVFVADNKRISAPSASRCWTRWLCGSGASPARRSSSAWRRPLSTPRSTSWWTPSTI